jgi:hypothetical protein
MTKSLLYLMSAVMAGVFGLSITACSADYDGNSTDEAELVGTWDAVSSQFYAEGKGYSQPGLGDGYWVITQRTITQYDHKDEASPPSGYIYDGRKLNIGGAIEHEVVTLNRQQMLLRTEVQKGIYREITFKRR